MIPLALIVQPYLRSDIPRYVAYATMGLILSHEMVHSLDLTGLRYVSLLLSNHSYRNLVFDIWAVVTLFFYRVTRYTFIHEPLPFNIFIDIAMHT